MDTTPSKSSPPNIGERYASSLLVGSLFALGVMILLPISQILSAAINSSNKQVEVTVMAPPEIMELPPPPEEEEIQEEIEELEEEREPPTLEQLEIAMNADVSGLVGGDFSMPTYDIGNEVQEMIFSLKDLTTPPKPIFREEPVYPLEMKRAGINGNVTLLFVIRSDGTTSDIRVLDSTNDAFEEPAIRAVRRWKFEPGEKDGKKVNTRVKQPIPFNVD